MSALERLIASDPNLAWALAESDPFEAAAARTRRSVLPEKGRREGLATVLPELIGRGFYDFGKRALVDNPRRMWQSSMDQYAPLEGRTISTDDPTQAEIAGGFTGDLGFTMLGGTKPNSSTVQAAAGPGFLERLISREPKPVAKMVDRNSLEAIQAMEARERAALDSAANLSRLEQAGWPGMQKNTASPRAELPGAFENMPPRAPDFLRQERAATQLPPNEMSAPPPASVRASPETPRAPMQDLTATEAIEQRMKALSQKAYADKFSTDAYHGTGKFVGDTILPDRYAGAFSEGGFYSTPSPNLASGYAKGQTWGAQGGQPQVMPLRLNTEGYLPFDGKGQHWTKVNSEAIAAARQAGAPGVRVKNVFDGAEFDVGANPNGLNDVFITLDPRTARSRWAKFDPANADTGLLLGARTVDARGVPVAAAAQSPQGIRAYHGSPHDFERFDLSRIGTGEGAQSYGHGLYFAENPAVARSYKNSLGKDPTVTVDGRQSVIKPGSAEEMAQHYWNEGRSVHPSNPYSQALDDLLADKSELRGADLRKLMTAESILKQWESKGAKIDPGKHMYEVNINAKPEQFLDWDSYLKPEQKLSAQRAIKGAPNQERLHQYIDEIAPSEYPTTGKEIYQMMVGRYGQGNLDRGATAASDVLRQGGIPGIRYLDQGSRDIGKGTSNYVVFDDKLIDILKKYGITAGGPLGALMVGDQRQ